MKRFVISTMTAVLVTSGAAWADKSIVVMTPKDPTSKEQATLYVAQLDSAVRQVCMSLASPVIGVNVHTYQGCLKATRADLAAREPTGLYSGRDSSAGTAIAAR